MSVQTLESQGVRVAVEGCGHGTLNAIYAAVGEACKARGWDSVDVLIIGGDFQAVRNAADLTVMSVPAKYREMGDFWEYYSGVRRAPYLTLFTAGNHEAASHLWELYYGGWVAPNIYYIGAANVLRLGPLRIAAMSGIWKGFDYRKTHHERLPFNQDDVKSFYHVREIDVRKLLMLRSQVDIGLSHDWPRAVEKWGDQKSLWRMKPDFERESHDGSLGNVAAEYVLDRLRPFYWFSAHLHCKYSALKIYDDETVKPQTATAEEPAKETNSATNQTTEIETQPPAENNPDEIDLDDDDDDAAAPAETASSGLGATPNGQSLDDGDAGQANQANQPAPQSTVSEELRAQLPASFTKRTPQPKQTPGQPVPPQVTNKHVRFLALDKCLPKRNFLQLVEIHPQDASQEEKAISTTDTTPDEHSLNHPGRFPLQYDPEWLAITRVFHNQIKIGDRNAQTPTDQGEAYYAQRIDAEQAWVEENVVTPGKLDVPANFELTAPPHDESQNWRNMPDQPFEYTNPQTATFCKLLGLKNHWDASDEERLARKAMGPPPSSNPGFRGGHRGGGRGGRGRGGGGGRGGGRGRGRGRFH